MNIIKKLRRYRWYIIGRYKIKKRIWEARNVKLVLGSGGTNYNGWIATDLPHFNILKEKDWKFFLSKKKAENLLAEHVLEHLTEEEVILVLKFSYKYLNNGGVFRIAVPDKNHPNPEYVENVKPGGIGPGADDHKSFWDYNTLIKAAEFVGFTAKPLEYCNENKEIITSLYNQSNGIIQRSISYGIISSINQYSSLIIDAFKN